MVDIVSAPVLLGAVVGGLLLYLWRSRRPRLPPGPPALPLLGNLLQLSSAETFQRRLLRWARQYGELYTIWLFNTPVVVVNSKDAIREALLDKSVEFAERPESFVFNYFGRGGKLLPLAHFTEEYKMQKKMAATSLRIYGDGMQRLESISQEVLQDFTSHLAAAGSEPLDIGAETQKAIVNVITSLVFGRRFAWDDPDFKTLNSVFDNIPGYTPDRLLLDAAPWIRHVLPLQTWTRLKDLRKTLDEFFLRHIKQMKADYDPDDIKCFAEAIYQRTLVDGTGNKALDHDLFVMTVFTIFLAGFGTTSVAMKGFILNMLHHPDVEKKLVAEIDTVLGTDRLPCLEDKSRMPYLEACIHELLRYSSHVPIALPHMTSTDVQFRGYTLPKGTTVFLNVNNMHHDERQWTEPWKFCPERFLDPQTGEVFPPGHPTRQSLMPFGAGRRVCIGEAMAKNRLFLFLAGLYQKFKFVPEEGVPLPTHDSRDWKFNNVLQVPNFKVKVLPRHETDQK